MTARDGEVRAGEKQLKVKVGHCTGDRCEGRSQVINGRESHTGGKD